MSSGMDSADRMNETDEEREKRKQRNKRTLTIAAAICGALAILILLGIVIAMYVWNRNMAKQLAVAPTTAVSAVSTVAAPTTAVPTVAAPVQTQSITWGPGGPAPQDLADATSTLGLSQQMARYITELNAESGNPAIIGWVVGNPATAEEGRIFSASLPAGVVIDFDPGSCELTGDVSWEVQFLPTWHRAEIGKSGGEISGLKFSIYWTPGEKASGTIVK